MSDTKPQPILSLGYALRVTDGKVYAVEWADDWKPVRALGPIEPKDLAAEPDALDWSKAIDASKWNAARLVDLCEAERERMIGGGGQRGGNCQRRSAAQPQRRRGILERPAFDEVKAGADGAAGNSAT